MKNSMNTHSLSVGGSSHGAHWLTAGWVRRALPFGVLFGDPFCGHGRDCDDEPRTGTGSCDELDVPAVGMRDRLHDGEPEAGTTSLATTVCSSGAGAPSTPEALEDPFRVVGRYSRTGVVDPQCRRRARHGRADANAVRLSRESHGVGGQLEDRLG